MNVEEAVLDALKRYYSDFSTLDLDRFLRHYHAPATIQGPANAYAVHDSAALKHMFSGMVDDLKARGYGRSEFVSPQITPLGTASALATGTAIRYKTDGQELERVPLSYLMHDGPGGWKIAALVVHA